MRRSTEGRLLNAGLVVLALALGVLAYGFATRLLHPPVAGPVASASSADDAAGIVQVEVLNGTGVDGLAARTREHLRTAGGFDVLDARNAPGGPAARTRVVDRVGNRAGALRVARALGLGEDAVVSEPRSDLFVDATVVLGQDYRTLTPFHAE